MPALKCLQFALNADKDLMRLFESISAIRSKERFDSLGSAQALDELRLNDSYRNDMAMTYLNMCSVLSQMRTHEKALNMAQKAIELVTNQRNVYCFNLETSISQLEEKSKITLATAYYYKALELDHLNQSNKLKREYALMAYSSIKNALLVMKYIPNAKELGICDEITKFHEKVQPVNPFRESSRGSSRRTQKRIFSPPGFPGGRLENSNPFQNFFDSSPNSSDGTIKPVYYSRTNEEKGIPFFINRKSSKGERTNYQKADKSILPSHINSLDSKGSDSESNSFYNRNPYQQNGLPPQRKRVQQILKQNIQNFTGGPGKKLDRRRFEVPQIPAFKRSVGRIVTQKSIGNLTNKSGEARKSQPDRFYIDESDFIREKIDNLEKIEKVHRTRKKKNKSTRTTSLKL